ncbi:hypothetical protein WME91_56160 [Sorangium sp. So ce269]
MRYVAHALSFFVTLAAATGFTRSASAGDIHRKATTTYGSTVKEHVRRGQRARNAGRWTEAHAAYKAAFEAAADPATSTERERAELAGELGLCELALHKYRDAAEHLARSLEQRETLPLARQPRFEAGQREAAKHVARLVLSVDPPDAEVFIDGQRLGRTARTYTLFFEPGKHLVRGRAPGAPVHEDGLHSFLAAAGAEHEITMKLPRAAMCWQAPKDSPCTDLLRLRDARNLSAGVGTALVITGGVIGAVTAASFFTDFSFLGFTPTQDRIHVAPVATGRETGVRIEGLW